MLKKHKDIVWMVAVGLITKAEAARKFKVSTQAIDTKLFNGLVEILKDKEIIHR